MDLRQSVRRPLMSHLPSPFLLFSQVCTDWLIDWFVWRHVWINTNTHAWDLMPTAAVCRLIISSRPFHNPTPSCPKVTIMSRRSHCSGDRQLWYRAPIDPEDHPRRTCIDALQCALGWTDRCPCISHTLQLFARTQEGAKCLEHKSSSPPGTDCVYSEL